MAKKTTAKKTSKKTTAKKVAKKTTKKTVAKKTAKKAAAKKTTKKVAKKAPAKKAPAKKTKAAKTTKKTAKKTAKKTVARKTTAKKQAPIKVPATPTRPKKIKTTLSRDELKMYRELLLEKRTELLGDIGTMEEGALRNSDSSNLSNMPLHMADVGSDNYDQELTLGLVESERKLLRAIDEALLRIQDKTYGMCMHTGKPINKARLEIKPWAKYSVEAARALEHNGDIF